ncbi:hypothetical protein T303_04515 [Streptococcus thermophilus ASCC 1275]|jgi:hypothetical protein|uniref:Uncharacterized protein n=2 Tax=Streptococcus thermophilus TaxID=1308 RepID=A0A8D6U2T7_STRTR|nr:hypothetical protein T303_04515 [Streptococcus thermophilus ASCC 1275]ETW90485.1 hypothetical protein X841_04020 [Streptococcus thermophilus M17PTZA496]CAD0136973.1 conserved protein of unknown function [Streptococcus thermophilus]
MDELKEIKLKNYQYLNKVAIKGETLFTGSSLMEIFTQLIFICLGRPRPQFSG